jgi:hypothetical protein
MASDVAKLRGIGRFNGVDQARCGAALYMAARRW